MRNCTMSVAAPPAARTTATTLPSACANCSLNSRLTMRCSASQAICPATNSSLPPSTSTPLLYPRGGPSVSGLMNVIRMSNGAGAIRRGSLDRRFDRLQPAVLFENPLVALFRVAKDEAESGHEVVVDLGLADLAINAQRFDFANRQRQFFFIQDREVDE